MAAQWIIPSYLEDLCGRKRQFYRWNPENQLMMILHDMAEWFEQVGGLPKAVLSAESVLNFDSRSQALALVELVDQMRLANEIRFASTAGSLSGPGRVPVAVIDPQTEADQPSVVRIMIGTINEVLQSRSAPAIHLGDVQADLVSQSAWRGSLSTEQGEDWLIDAQWWWKQIKMIHRKRRCTTLPTCRIVSPIGASEPPISVQPTSPHIDAMED